MLADAIRLVAATILTIALMATLRSERMLISVAAPVARAARRAIVRTSRILRSTLRTLVPVEHAAFAARTTRFHVAMTAIRVAIGPRSVLHPCHMARFTTLLSTVIAATLAAIRPHGPTATRTQQRERKHEKRAIHNPPLRTAIRRHAHKKRSGCAHRSGQYNSYRRHNRQNPTNRNPLERRCSRIEGRRHETVFAFHSTVKAEHPAHASTRCYREMSGCLVPEATP
jgi:hypothetical protein